MTWAKSGFEYSIRLLQQKEKVCVTDNFFFLRIMIPEYIPNKTVYDSMHFYRHFTIHDIPNKFARPEILSCFVLLRITGEGSVPEMRIWSILLIKSDIKWCIYLSRSLFSYFNYLVSVTAGGPDSPRGYM